MSDSKIKCEICGAECHAIAVHLRDAHPEINIEKYKSEYPDAPLLSDAAKAKIEARKKEIEAAKKVSVAAPTKSLVAKATSEAMHKLFGMTASAKTKRKDGSPIMVDVLADNEWKVQVPDVDDRYVFDPEMLKLMLMGLMLNIPTFLWGHAGTGKTTIIEQIAARTNRPLIRSQHTGSTEESHILGQIAANETGTYFEPGPLPLAMKYGWIYLADEYDFAFPQVLAVYQSVLEGKALVIKEAPADSEWRVVHPHPNFRFFATGNTNGAGDESGLYLGTNVQNAANFERFGIVEQMPYMDKKHEAKIVASQGHIASEDAAMLVKFAGLVRDAFEARKISATCGPRVLINAAKVGVARASFMKGIQSAFINRLNMKDREIVTQLAQRVLDEAR